MREPVANSVYVEGCVRTILHAFVCVYSMFLCLQRVCLSACATSESGMYQDIVNSDDQHRDALLHVLHARGTFTQSNLDRLRGGETRVRFMPDKK